MREKQACLVVTFHTTAAAMAMEKHCKQAGIPGKLIPIPRTLSADCGIAWRCGQEVRPQIEAIIEEAGLEAEGLFAVLL